jgi:hypothetical protein
MLCTIPTGGVWTLIQLPNLSPFPPAGFPLGHITGDYSYYELAINLCVGSTYIAPATNAWYNTNYSGAPGMDNFAAKPVNTAFYLAFVQHEPGPVCTQFMDVPFEDNLLDCQRY